LTKNCTNPAPRLKTGEHNGRRFNFFHHAHINPGHAHPDPPVTLLRIEKLLEKDAGETTE
jgi:hypothetical protein